ncbi:MAG: hypothetical protein O8C62_10500 [Candidatus Methanoperedens sp.]|nr:hypothetical protein [Candidatus Methanoperedens sp.]
MSKNISTLHAFSQDLNKTIYITSHMNYILAITLVILFIILPVPSLAMSNGYARTVYNVRGLQDYDLHWNDRFPPGSAIKIYVEADGINHRREVAVDYVFIIRDSNNNIVDTASYSNTFHDYRENDFITYSREVPESWTDGVYKVEIDIFDLLNDSSMDRYYNDVALSYLNGSSKPDVPVMSRGTILNLSNAAQQHMQIEKTFYIDRYASKYPIDRFRVEGIMLDRTNAAPNEPVQVSANITNTFYDTGSTNLSLLLDNTLINTTAFEVEAYSSRHAVFTVSTNITGNHKVEIIPTGKNTAGLNLSAFFNVSAEKEPEVPTTIYFRDLQIDHLSVAPNETVTILVTAENKGKEGSSRVDLYINNLLIEERDVHMNFSETKDIKFNVTKAEPGAYRVTVGNTSLNKIFFVETVTATPTAKGVPGVEKKPQLKSVILLSILVVFIVILRLYLKKKLK